MILLFEGKDSVSSGKGLWVTFSGNINKPSIKVLLCLHIIPFEDLLVITGFYSLVRSFTPLFYRLVALMYSFLVVNTSSYSLSLPSRLLTSTQTKDVYLIVVRSFSSEIHHHSLITTANIYFTFNPPCERLYSGN